MPIIEVKMLEGRTLEQKARLSRTLTDVTVDILEIRPDAVRVLIHELPPEHWSVGGISFAERER